MHTLHYKQAANMWTEALPMGNGRIGAMAFSGVFSERYALNEETLWCGYPRDRSNPEVRTYVGEIKQLIQNKEYKKANQLIEGKMLGADASTYLPFGDIRIDLKRRCDFMASYTKGQNLLSPDEVTDYTRELDMKTAVVSSSFIYNGNRISRRAFVSHPDQVFVSQITSEQKGDLHFDLRFSGAMNHSVTSGNKSMTITGKCPSDVRYGVHAIDPDALVYEYDDTKDTIPFCCEIKVITDGTCVSAGGAMFVCDASYATILAAIRTGFVAWDLSPAVQGNAYARKCAEDIENAAGKTFDELLERHIKDYAPLYERCEITLGEKDTRPTDELLAEEKDAFPQSLAALMFHYNRYLLIASSREGTKPTNLQGIWNSEVLPPWRSDYTVNINTEMNYWSAEMCALPECHKPLFSFLRDAEKAGRVSAKDYFDADGWAMCHNTDIWGLTLPAGCLARYAYWPMAGLWFCRHIWEHYSYNQDEAFLEENFEVLSGALDFLNSWLYETEDGVLTTVCSISPENAFSLDGELCAVSGITAMDIGIILDFSDYMVKICDILGGKEEIRNRCAYIMEHLAKYQIGSDGRLLEWSEEFTEPDPGHRHISHLYGVHPGNSIRPGSAYFEACRKSLDYRLENGGGQTGWSNAWIINQYARMADGEKAYKYVKNMFHASAYRNLFDAHPPFQIDGNFGFGSGLGEMLLQSSEESITLLPAVSREMDRGSVRGMRARGGFTVSFAWENGVITSYTITKDGTEYAADKNQPYPLTISIKR